jgi:4-hydroxy-3-methylbut-2-enyl diphosphate reductase
LADLALSTTELGEAMALAIGPGIWITGAGPSKADAATALFCASISPGTPVALSGVAYGMHPDRRSGSRPWSGSGACSGVGAGSGVGSCEFVVATELWATDGTPPRLLPSAAMVAHDLRRAGLSVRTGPLVSSSGPLSAEEATAFAADGAIAWDMESAWLARQLPDHALAVVRVFIGPSSEGAAGASGASGASGEASRVEVVRASLERWAQANRPHQVLLASPRSFCAGVERAIEIVERAIVRFGGPVYVRRQIVHNLHVVSDLEAKGAVFVTELDEVPDGSTVVLAAHGVSPAIRAAAADRIDLNVIDATCPLVAKVHHEARRFVAQDYQIVLVGHAEHEEVIGTVGEAPDQIQLVQHPDDVAALDVEEGRQVAYLTQTTLSTDDTAHVIDALRRRFPGLVGPTTTDICYATQNRQDAVRVIAGQCDLMLVVGSANSSNTARLVEVARREGCRAELIEDASGIDLGWLEHSIRIGITAGASAPESLVTEVVESLQTLGPATVTEHRTTEETVQFSLPRQVR